MTAVDLDVSEPHIRGRVLRFLALGTCVSVLWVTSYYLLIQRVYHPVLISERVRSPITGEISGVVSDALREADPIPSYRFGGKLSEVLFEPILLLDLRIRPQWWSRIDLHTHRLHDGGPNPRLASRGDENLVLVIGTLAVIVAAAFIAFTWGPVAWQHSRRKKLRFSIRTLAIAIAVFGGYCGLWRATELWGVRRELGNDQQQTEIAESGIRGYAVAPFVICVQSPAEIWMLPDGTWKGEGIVRRFVIWNPWGRNFALHPREADRSKGSD